MWKLALLCCSAIWLIVISIGRPSNTGSGNLTFPRLIETQQPAAVDPVNTIDGAKNPELIPDHVAYSAIFRMLSNRSTQDEVYRARAYVTQMGLGKQPCKVCPPGFGTADADVNGFLATAEEYYQRVRDIDKQVAEIKDQTWPNPSAEVLAQLLCQRVDQRVAILFRRAHNLHECRPAERGYA